MTTTMTQITMALVNPMELWRVGKVRVLRGMDILDAVAFYPAVYAAE